MSSLTLFQVDIPKRAAICANCQEALLPETNIYSLLKESQKEGAYLRFDTCFSCSEKEEFKETLIGVCSNWKSRVPSKKEVSSLPKERDLRAMSLLKEAVLENESRDPGEAFVLALYLARKRLIFFRQTLKLEDGQLASLYEVAETEEMLCVRKPELSSLEIEKTQLSLAAKFKA